MKIRLFLFASILFASNSCTKKPTACIDGPIQLEEYSSATYTWCGTDADNVEWTLNGSNVIGTGNSFTPVFPAKGKYTIIAKGTNKKSEKSTTFEVSVGRFPTISCVITGKCGYPHLPNDANLAKYKAYLYNSKSDWATDVNNKNHNLADDSASYTYDEIWKVVSFVFKKLYPVGSKKIISVEYTNPSDVGILTSNWSDIMTDRSGTIEIKYSSFTETSDNNTGTTSLDYDSKKFITNLTESKWMLTKKTINYASSPLGCKAGDYMKFNANGTWSYVTAVDDCTSNGGGTYTMHPDPCNNYNFGSFTTNPGSPFSIEYVQFTSDEMQVISDSDNRVIYHFSYSN